MLAQRHSSHERKHDDEKRLRFTLGLSLLLHAALLLAWKLPAQTWKVADSAVLTVMLRAAPPLSPATPAATQQDSAVLTQKEPAPATFSAPPQALMQGAVVPSAAHPQPLQSTNPARVAVQPTPGHPSRAAPGPVGVTVLLVVGTEGRVEQIVWDQLPALTDEQLRRVESVIREKTYLPRQTVSEVVDVRTILKLSPAHTDEELTVAAPAGGG